MISAAHKAGAAGVLDGKNCRDCHAGEEKDMGDVIVSGQKLEPTPLPGKPGTAKVSIQAAFDAENLYLRARWADDGKPGVHYRLRALKDVSGRSTATCAVTGPCSRASSRPSTKTA